MAKKKTAKKEAPATVDVEIVEEYDATRYTPWIPGNMPVGGKSNSTEQLNDHPTEHNHSAEAISDIVDRFADLRLYVPAANSCGVDGNLKVDGQIIATGGGGPLVPRFQIGDGSGLGMYGSTGNQWLRFATDDTERLRIDADRTYAYGDLQAAGQIKSIDGGSKDAPAFQIGPDKALGMFGSINSQWIRFTTDGEYRFQIGAEKLIAYKDLQVDGQIKAQNGTRSAPAYSFASDNKAGFHRPATNVIELVANGKRLMQLGIDAGDVETGAWMPTINTRTKNIPANVYIEPSAAEEGALFRCTASRAFMQEIEAVNLDATNNVYDLQPIWFRSKCDGDNLEHSHYGLAAEDCAAVDPRLAIMATDENGVETADNVNTNAVIALLVSAVQEQRATISDLTARVEALENA